MQGDIFMLDQTSMPISVPTTTSTKTNKKLQVSVAQVAIYNEDGLSHLLYAGSAIEPAAHPHHIHHHDHHDGSLTPLTAPASSGTHTPLFSDHEGLSDNESAVFEDWEQEQHHHHHNGELDLDFEIPPSPVPRRRGGTMCSTDSDFEWPVFLGRQADELAPALRRRSSASSAASLARERAPVAPTNRVPHEHHVSSIEGPLMSLWPAAAVEDLEWQERFYE